MSTENTNMEQNANATPAEITGGQKTFSQEDVNRIVHERLAKAPGQSIRKISAKRKRSLRIVSSV